MSIHALLIGLFLKHICKKHKTALKSPNKKAQKRFTKRPKEELKVP
jgi:hypothetical protein